MKLDQDILDQMCSTSGDTLFSSFASWSFREALSAGCHCLVCEQLQVAGCLQRSRRRRLSIVNPSMLSEITLRKTVSGLVPDSQLLDQISRWLQTV